MRKNALLAASAVTATFALSVAAIQPSGAAPGAPAPDGLVKSTHQLASGAAVAKGAAAAARGGANTLHAAAADRFRVKAALQDNTGETNVRLERTHRGLRVLGGDSVVHRSATGASPASPRRCAGSSPWR